MANFVNRNISYMISTNYLEVSTPIWNLILEHYLQEFVREDSTKNVTNPVDLKLFTSCLANAKILGIISWHAQILARFQIVFFKRKNQNPEL